ncbi:hypothetical protein B0T09DRAFT_31768 [Sordaria sp. MPI-SDFR-AT-0083]|nr:hypothetical protein B0T09DRAFT_31768 [Sordaria sp. MPI-SDFR-AT-0083]
MAPLMFLCQFLVTVRVFFFFPPPFSFPNPYPSTFPHNWLSPETSCVYGSDATKASQQRFLYRISAYGDCLSERLRDLGFVPWRWRLCILLCLPRQSKKTSCCRCWTRKTGSPFQCIEDLLNVLI